MPSDENLSRVREIDAFDDAYDMLGAPIEAHDIEAELEKSEPDRRGQSRYLTVMRAARLSSTVHRIEALGVVRNVSEGGMKIEACREFAVGEKITVSLLDGDRTEGRVVWADGKTIGVQFANEIAIDHLLAKPRTLSDGTRARPPRLTLNSKAIIRVGSYMAETELCDISQRGAKIRFGRSLAIDSRVQISLENLRPVSGSVKWQVDRLIGLEFHRTLPVGELSAWVASMSTC